MRKRFVLILAAALVLLAAVGFVSLNSKERRPQVKAAEVPSASVAEVSYGSVERTLNLAGQFQPYQVIDVHAKVSGYIRKIFVDIGDHVQQGQTLAILEVPELNAQLKGTISEVERSKHEIVRAQSQVTRAESQYSALHAVYERLQKASATQPGLIAQQELDDARSKDLAAQAQIDEAKAALESSRQQANVASANKDRVGALAGYTKVIAPLDGVIVWRYADTGALIQAGTASDTQSLPVVKLSQSNLLRLRIPVPQDAVRYIHEGSEVQLHVDALDRSLTGKIVRFTRDINFSTGTMETEIDVENKDLSLTPGMYANAILQLEKHDHVLTIPSQAIIKSGNETSVLVVDSQNQVHRRKVELGIQGTAFVEVIGGLKEGEKVITGGQSGYKEGEEVHPQLVPTASFTPKQEEGEDQ